MNTRTDSEGNKVLFLEEVQSDWGQKGKKDGFVEKIDKNNIQNVREDENVWVVKFDDGSFLDISKKEAKNADEAKALALQSKKERFVGGSSKIPTAPFVTDTNAWTKLGLKVALKEAVTQGAERIAWTTGGQQNERYDLSKQVDAIEVYYNPNQDTPSAPFITDTNAWTKLGLKGALKEAVAQGAERIAWTTGEQQNERYDLSEQVDDVYTSSYGEEWVNGKYEKRKDVEITLKGLS